MNELITVQGIRGRLNTEGYAELSLEDVARGLGFTQIKSGIEYVRWETVFGYLADVGFSQQVGKGSFIPENIFYKLCFKAKNEVATVFQDEVTDEVLPAIRKHGAYMTPAKIEEVLLNPDTIIDLATRLKQEQQARLALEQTIEEQKPKVLFADAVTTAKTSILVGELAKILKQNGIMTGQNRLFEWLREKGFLIKRRGTDYNMPSQRSMELGLFEIKETSVVHADGHTSINKTPKVTTKGQAYFINIFLEKETT